MIDVLPEVQGLIFDCDGTLADTMPIHIKAWRETFADYGIHCPEKFLHAFKGMPAVRIVERFNRLHGHRIDPVAFARKKNQRAGQMLHRSQPIEPVVAIVRQYRDKLPMAVASGGTRENVLLTLQSIGFENCFAAVLTFDDDVAPKPDPEIFLEAARRIKVAPGACQVFEDGDAGLEAARRAGMIATDIRGFIG